MHMLVRALFKRLITLFVPEAFRAKRREYLALRGFRKELELRRVVQNEHASISIKGDSNACSEAKILSDALISTLGPETRDLNHILAIDGMSGKKYRRLINEIVSSMPNPRYLEIGSWAGSTACAAMFGNKAKITCVDDWSQFGGPKEEFLENARSALNLSLI